MGAGGAGQLAEGVRWSRDAWHFFLHLLHALKLLLAGGRLWEKGGGGEKVNVIVTG